MFQTLLPVTSDPDIILKLLEQTAQRLEISIRYETILIDKNQSQTSGGLCKIKGKNYIIINSKLLPAEKCLVIRETLRNINMDNIFIPPLIRQLLS
ncbi:MAG: hypothetical protein JXR91_07115 [Deltaproteobacteria bacterium]|nr:hypothetical protein [Deltaproteobacteria bacterium]